MIASGGMFGSRRVSLQCLDLNIPEVMERTWTALEVEGMLEVCWTYATV